MKLVFLCLLLQLPLNLLRPRKRINFKKKYLADFLNFMITSSTSGEMAAILVGRQ